MFGLLPEGYPRLVTGTLGVAIHQSLANFEGIVHSHVVE